MKNTIPNIFLFLFVLSLQAQEKTVPIFKEGEAQIVAGFSNPKSWIRHDLWVETSFDTDGDGRLDRMHVCGNQTKSDRIRGIKTSDCI